MAERGRYRTHVRFKPEHRDFLYDLKAAYEEKHGKTVSINTVILAILDWTMEQDFSFSSHLDRGEEIIRRAVGE